MFSNRERLEKIKKSIKVGDVVNGCNGYISKWYTIADINNIDTPIEDRCNVKYIIKLKTIDRDECDIERVYFISDLLQFALIQYDS